MIKAMLKGLVYINILTHQTVRINNVSKSNQNFPVYGTQSSDSEAQILEHWGMWSDFYC